MQQPQYVQQAPTMMQQPQYMQQAPTIFGTSTMAAPTMVSGYGVQVMEPFGAATIGTSYGTVL